MTLDGLDLAPHHLATCRSVVAAFQPDPLVLAVLLVDSVIDHLAIDRERLTSWPMHFMRDTELAWQTGCPPVDEL